MPCCSANADCKQGGEPPCPMWVLKVKDMLTMSGPLPCHEDLQTQKLLSEWQPHFFTTFVSHQWLGQKHPDETGHQIQCLRQALINIISGRVTVEFDVLAQSFAFMKKLQKREIQDIANGHLWLDWVSVPQRGGSADAAEYLCQSVHIYLERSNLFCILAPRYNDPEGGEYSYATWEQRGWCRAEMWLKQLSMRAGPGGLTLQDMLGVNLECSSVP